MKKPKKGDIVITPNEPCIWIMPNTEYEVVSIGEFGFFIKVQSLSGGRYYISYSDNWQIKEPDPKEYKPIISLVLAIVIVLLLIFSSFYFKF